MQVKLDKMVQNSIAAASKNLEIIEENTLSGVQNGRLLHFWNVRTMCAESQKAQTLNCLRVAKCTSRHSAQASCKTSSQSQFIAARVRPRLNM
jgi:hypothetical protein